MNQISKYQKKKNNERKDLLGSFFVFIFLFQTYPEDSAGTAHQGFSDLISRSLKHVVRPDLCNTSKSDSDLGISRSKSELDLTGQFLPAVISKTGSVLPLPVTYDDLAQILRLPMPVSADKDLIRDVKSIIRVVYPTSDDILVEMSKRSSDFIPVNEAFKDCFGKSFSGSNVDQSTEKLSTDLFADDSRVESSWSTWKPMTASSTLDCFSLTNSHRVQTFSSNCDHDCHLPSCNFFSSSSPNKAETSNPSSNNGVAQGKSSGKGTPSPEQMQEIKEKLEKAASLFLYFFLSYSFAILFI